MDEHPFLYHIVLTLHNSRTSRRMYKLGIRTGPVHYLKIEDEIELTAIIKSILVEENIPCYAYNVCRDHVHMVIESTDSELSKTIKVIKGKSAFMYNRSKDIKGAFWSQKFFSADLDNWKIVGPDLLRFSKRDSYFRNAVKYIRNNREKHGLPESQKLKELISSFVISSEGF